MDTIKIIEHFAKKEEKYDVFSNINLSLQRYFIEDIPEESVLEVVQELHSLLKFDQSIVAYSHVGDGEYSMDTPFNQMYYKLQELTYLYPEKEFIKEYLDKLSQNYSKDPNEFSYSYSRKKEKFFEYLPDFDCTPEIHASFMEEYFIKNNIQFHPAFSVFKDFEKLVNNLNNNSKDIEELQKFWEANSKVLKISCANANIWELPNAYAYLLIKPEIIKNINQANNLMIVETRARVAKKLFKNFLNYPEMQDNLSEKFPLFFKFSDWMKPIDRKGFHYQLEEHHIDTLSKYKHRTGYSSYITNTFNIHIDEYENYSLLLTKLAQKSSLFTRLFDKVDDSNKNFDNCHSLSELLKKNPLAKFDSKNMTYVDFQNKNKKFLNFLDNLVIQAEHDELQKELPKNIGMETKRIKL
jgi:hypothetical protein